MKNMPHVIVVTGQDKVDQTVAGTVLPATVRIVGPKGVRKATRVNAADEMKAVLNNAFSLSETGDQVQVESRRGAR
jgi:hypothetical protein